MSVQLTLSGIQLAEDATFANYCEGKNQQLTTLVAQLAGGYSSDFYIYFWGEHGSGKSHLLQACCHAAESAGASAIYLPLPMFVKLAPDVLCDLEQLNLVCIDDIDCIAGLPNWEEALFDLYNRLQQAECRLLIAASKRPAELGIQLPDLVSRLNAGIVMPLHCLSDQEKMLALQERAQERGFKLTDEVAQFILRRCSRNMADLFQALDTLDQASLMAQRRVTIPFVKAVLHI